MQKNTWSIYKSFGNWEDPPLWEKFPNNPVIFFGVRTLSTLFATGRTFSSTIFALSWARLLLFTILLETTSEYCRETKLAVSKHIKWKTTRRSKGVAPVQNGRQFFLLKLLGAFLILLTAPNCAKLPFLT